MAFFSNIRFSLRILRKHAKLACIAIFSLAIGMAAASIGLSTYNALLVQPPAVPRTPSFTDNFHRHAGPAIQRALLSGLSLLSRQQRCFLRTLRHSFQHQHAAASFSSSHEKHGLINAVSDNYFSVLGVQPFLGSWFAVGEDVKLHITRS